jgi:hypothetical protein
MATSLYTLKLAGFTSAGVPTTGAGHIANKTVTLWDDGSLHFTDAAGNNVVLPDVPELNKLLVQLVVGGSGVPTTKSWNK